jgi:hypothetical protein
LFLSGFGLAAEDEGQELALNRQALRQKKSFLPE